MKLLLLTVLFFFPFLTQAATIPQSSNFPYGNQYTVFGQTGLAPNETGYLLSLPLGSVITNIHFLYDAVNYGSDGFGVLCFLDSYDLDTNINNCDSSQVPLTIGQGNGVPVNEQGLINCNVQTDHGDCSLGVNATCFSNCSQAYSQIAVTYYDPSSTTTRAVNFVPSYDNKLAYGIIFGEGILITLGGLIMMGLLYKTLNT